MNVNLISTSDAPLTGQASAFILKLKLLYNKYNYYLEGRKKKAPTNFPVENFLLSVAHRFDDF